MSPSTVVNPTYNRGAALAWDTPDFGDYRKDLSCLESSGTVPSISRQQAPEYTPPPYGRNNRPSHLASNLFNNNSFYNSSSDDLPQMSPGFIPQNGNNLSLEWNGDDRRPSVASTTTMSSTGSSKRSITGKFHKKLQGFFGEDFDPNAPPPKDPPEQQNQRGRNPSNATQVTQTTRPGSPSASRPRTPNTSSEVTPWDFEPAPANVSLFCRIKMPGRVGLTLNVLVPYAVDATAERSFPTATAADTCPERFRVRSSPSSTTSRP